MTAVPALSRRVFARRLAQAPSSPRLDEPAIDRLFEHYQELQRWAPRMDLIGPGAAGELPERHYAESLVASAWIPQGARLLDLGSGAGFPGFVLAAARPDLEVWLVEPRARRAAFLAAAARRAGLSLQVVNARVAAAPQPDLPTAIDRLTVRALRLDARSYRALLPHLAPDARLLSWSGAEPPEMPEPFEAQRTVQLAESSRRYLREYSLRQVAP